MEKDINPPVETRGNSLIILTACQGENRNCPNLLIRSNKWESMVDDWFQKNNLSERLRKKIKSEKILRHHKVSVVIAGCPNGCSKPYTANIGLVGFVKPDVEPDLCTSCGACQEICPDLAINVVDGPPNFDREKCLGCFKCRDICPTEAITLSKPGIRIYVGGKQGRHPKFGEIVAEVYTPEELFGILEKIFKKRIG